MSLPLASRWSNGCIQPRRTRRAIIGAPVGGHRLNRLPAPLLRGLQAHQQESAASEEPSSSGQDELPEELQDLAINEDGFLIDTKTGKVINEMGATRFDVAVRALRGELDPPAWVENTERSSGVLLAALYQFPRSYCFQVVGRPEPGPSGGDGSPDAFAADVAATVAAVAQAEVPEGGVVIKPRMGGRYVSVSVDVVVRAPEIVEMVYQKLGEDSRVIMRF